MSEEQSYSSFWEHIEELRQTLFRIFLIVLVGFSFACFFYKPLFQMLIPDSLENPLYVKEKLQHERIINSSSNSLTYNVPNNAFVFPNQSGIELIENNQYRIEPGFQFHYETPLNKHKLLILNPLEGILLSFKVSFWFSLAASSPFWVYCLLKFIMPALKERERKTVFPFIISSFCFIFLGLFIAYKVTIPLTNQYLEAFNAEIGQNLWSLRHYIDYTLIVMLGHAVAFELCVILLFMVHYNFLTTEWLVAKRRYMIVFAFVLGALLTPPDVLTQLLLAIPLMGVYEVAILYSRIRSHLNRKRGGAI